MGQASKTKSAHCVPAILPHRTFAQGGTHLSLHWEHLVACPAQPPPADPGNFSSEYLEALWHFNSSLQQILFNCQNIFPIGIGVVHRIHTFFHHQDTKAANSPLLRR